MGGFFLHLRKAGIPDGMSEQTLQKSIGVFQKKSLALDRKIVGDKFVVYRFHKRMPVQEQHVLEFANGDFILCSGTMLYHGMLGKPALARLYESFDGNGHFDEVINGQFCVIIYKNGQLSLLSDYCRYYPVYENSSGTVFSSSFLAVAKTGSAAVSKQEFFEFFLHGIFVDEGTLLRDVRTLDSRQIHRLLPERKRISRQPVYRAIPPGTSFRDMTKLVAAERREYFTMLGDAFGKTIGTALSGGYDSRLQLALLRSTGSTPVVHVYGGANSTDARVAMDIAAGEGFEVEHIDKSSFPEASPEEIAADAERALYFFDGIYAWGCFDNGADLATRLHRARKAPLQLNAGGAEIYREAWSIGDHDIDLVTFIRMRHDRGAYPFFRSSFELSKYVARFAEKIQQKLGIDRNWISRREAEMLMPFLRAWNGAVNIASNNQISYAIEPFMEARCVFPSFDIPIRLKYSGEFEASLIKEIDPALAKYDSQYGINFFDPVPLTYRLKGMAERAVPLSVRLLKRRIMLRKPPGPLPYYMQTDYLRQVIDLSNLKISEFIDITKIDNPMFLSRAVSVEMLLAAI